jgi:3-deoxy-7-phosphoheptulonate synthase
MAAHPPPNESPGEARDGPRDESRDGPRDESRGGAPPGGGRLPAIGRRAGHDAAPPAPAFEYNGVSFGGGAFHVFAGLCVVDTRESLRRTFATLESAGIVTARAGVWKPRTSPYDFQGLGKECLPWLFELAGAHGVRVVAIEVLSEAHIEDIHVALAETGHPTGVMLQIGTRNAQNFELLKAVGRQSELPVLLKRGMGISLEESLFAAEYVASHGNTRLAFCLRGVKTHLGEPHRNLVDFALLPVVKRLTWLPVCVDPSHAVGSKHRAPDGLSDVHHAAAQGVVAGADMLLVDVHPEPAAALCDGPQALTLDELPFFLDDMQRVRLVYETRARRARAVEGPEQALREARAGIEDVDAEILALLARRAALGLGAAEAKRALGLPVQDKEREEQNRRWREALARARGLDTAVVDALFEAIVAWSRSLQDRR